VLIGDLYGLQVWRDDCTIHDVEGKRRVLLDVETDVCIKYNWMGEATCKLSLLTPKQCSKIGFGS